MDIDIILKYFPNLSDKQKQQFEALGPLYQDWNSKINVISRKDIENLYEHHILHSLGIAKLIQFTDGTHILDMGTGGGFPGIPLAILFPKCKFLLIDSIGKKVLTVAGSIASEIGLTNVECRHNRVEDVKDKVDFVVSRAVMPLSNLIKIVRKNISKENKNALPNGVICLKGGNLEEEMKPFKKMAEADELSMYFEEEFFKTKKIVYVLI